MREGTQHGAPQVKAISELVMCRFFFTFVLFGDCILVMQTLDIMLNIF
jgi:hypothetical protein